MTAPRLSETHRKLLRKEEKQMSKNILKRMLALVLTFAMIVSFALTTVSAAEPQADSESVGRTDASSDRPRVDLVDDAQAVVNPDQVVRVSIVLEAPSTLAAGYSTEEIAQNEQAMTYRAGLKADQQKVADRIESEVLDGKQLDVVWNLTLAANIISANVRRGDIEAIEDVEGVKSVYVERQYSPDVVSEGDTLEPNMAVAGEMNGTSTAWDLDYYGEGSLIAIIDTGLDTDHQSFNNDAFLEAIQSTDNLKLTKDKVLAAAEELNAVSAKGADVDKLWRSEKVPYGWNYIDHKEDITHDGDDAGEHGSHVAGIAAANRLIPVTEDGETTYVDALDTVHMAGNAPDAQIMVMKVFGQGGGAFDGDCVAAIEDAIYLEADSVNLSLGMAIPGFASPVGTDDPYADIQQTLTNSDTVVVYSAGNAGSWADQTYNGYLYNDGVSYQMDGESGSYTDSFTVASADNDGFIGATATIGETEFGWTDGSIGPAFTSLDPECQGTTLQFVMLSPDAAGKDETLAPELDLDGKIYITWRGGNTSFYLKANAGYNAKAAGVFVANNTSGTISMDLTGYNGNIPVASILQSDALAIWNSVEEKSEIDGYEYITGSININGTVSAHNYNSTYKTMSSFSSWGTTGDLALKPEITAPGGNIWSVNGALEETNGYELMSGTSMAAPQITGMAALVQQYLREAAEAGEITLDEDASYRQLTQGLLMATAEPLKHYDEEYGAEVYWSLLQQGAGLANVGAAVTTPVIVTVDGQTDGKVKAEIGDDYHRTGKYPVRFTLTNITDKDVEYMLSADAFTQAYFSDPDYGEFSDFTTRDLQATTTFSNVSFDYDGDGDVDADADDAQALLDYVINGTVPAYHAMTTDVDGDGDTDTYDAHLLLTLNLNLNQTTLKVPAGRSVEVEAVITLSDDEIETLEAQNPAGAYIEAYIFAEAVGDEEGVLAPTLSIPVLGYYGSWTDASMYEIGTGEEWATASAGKVGGRYPYTYQGAYTGYNLTATNTLLDEEGYLIFNGDIIGEEESLLDYMYSQIRNSGNGIVRITDRDGEELWRSEEFGPDYGLTYYESAGFWLRASVSGSLYYNLYNYVDIDWTAVVKAIKELDKSINQVNISLILAPEYYADENGKYDWNELTDGIENADNKELGKGAYLTTALSIDLEAPVIGEITCTEETNKGEGDGRVITVQLTDNMDLAFAVLYDENYAANETGNPVEIKELEGGAALTVEFDGGDTKSPDGEVQIDNPLYDSIYRLVVTDAAGNTASKRFEVGDVKFTDKVGSITLSEDEIEIIVRSKYALSAEVGPYNLSDDAMGVKWSTEDNEIIEVDPDTGVITAVGVGQATVTATTVANSASGGPLTANCKVTVFSLPITAAGVLGDEGGHAKFFNWDFETGELKYNDNEEEDTVYPVALTTYTDDTYLTVDNDGVIYELDYDGTVKNSQSGTYYEQLMPFDMSYLKSTRTLWWTDGGYVMFDQDPFNPQLSGWDIGKQYGAQYGYPYAIAAKDNAWSSSTASGTYEVWVLLDGGYMLRMRPYVTSRGMSASLSFFPLGMDTSYVGNLDLSYSNMVIGADGAFYASIMTGETNEVYQIKLITTEGSTSFSRQITYLGDFGDQVWPGLFLTVENKPSGVKYDYDNDGAVTSADAETLQKDVVKETGTEDIVLCKDQVASVYAVDLDRQVVKSEPLTAKGGLDSIDMPDKALVTSIVVDETEHTVTVPVKVDKSTNGDFTLSYNAELLSVKSIDANTSVPLSVNTDTEGEIRIGYADKSAISAYLVNVVFDYDVNDAGQVAELTLAVDEDGHSHEGDTVTAEVELTKEHEHTEVTDPEIPATCTTPGYTGNTYCSECGLLLELGEIIPALDHEWDEGKITIDSTCESAGIKVITCNTCGEQRVEAIDATGHTSTDVEALDPTCTEAGHTAGKKCEVCGAILEGVDTIPAKGHTLVVDEAVAATCTEAGHTVGVTCAECDAVLVEEKEIPALGHDYGEWTVTKAATCTEAGEQAHTCKRCGEVETQAIEAFECPTAKFTDNPTGKWFHDAIDFMVENGLMNGVSETVFDTHGGLTRAQLVTILYRLEKEPEVEGTTEFTDVEQGRFYYSAVIWAAENGIVNGKNATTFDPNGSITRQEIATILYRYAEAEAVEEDHLSDFTDSAEVSAFAKDAMNWAVAEGLINGSGSKLSPKGNATRAEIAAILYRYLGR